MNRKVRRLEGVTISELQFGLGSINTSVARSKFSFGKKTPGLAIKYVGYGNENYLIKQKDLLLSQGQFMLIRNDVHFGAFKTNTQQASSGMCVNLDVFSDYDYSEIVNNDFLFNTPFTGCWSTTFGKCISDLSHNTNIAATDILTVYQKINEALEGFSGELIELGDRLSNDAKKKETRISLLVQLFKARDFIYQNFRHKTKLDELAKFVGISKYHFLRLFKKCFDISPLGLMHQLRMKAAKELIIAQNESLTSIAYELGYPDLPAFSNQFKKYFKVPPSIFIKRLA